MLPNRVDELDQNVSMNIAGIYLSQVSNRSQRMRKPFLEINPSYYGVLSNIFNDFNHTADIRFVKKSSWSAEAIEGFTGKNNDFKIVSVLYHSHAKNLIIDDYSNQLFAQRFNVNAGDVKDLLNIIYADRFGYNVPGMNFVDDAYVNFKVGDSLPKEDLYTLLDNLQICLFMQPHLQQDCLNNHPHIMLDSLMV